jgi:hypothetical protein
MTSSERMESKEDVVRRFPHIVGNLVQDSHTTITLRELTRRDLTSFIDIAQQLINAVPIR